MRILKAGQLGFKEIKGFGIGMGDGDSDTIPVGQRQPAPEFGFYDLRVRRRIKKDITAAMGEARFRHNLAGHALRGGEAVNKKGCFIEMVQGLGDPQHVSRVAGEQAAHVTVHATDVGDGCQVGGDGGDDLIAGHVDGDAAGAEIVAGGSLQGLVEHNLLALVVALPDATPGMGQTGQKGAGDRAGQRGYPPRMIRMLAKIINNQGYYGCSGRGLSLQRGAGQCQWRQQQGKRDKAGA